MSNEYKDWERDKIEEENQAITEYPFLRARNIDGTIDTESKFPMIGLEIPNGWYKLFFQMCDDIKTILEEKGKLNDFYFIQVKEKYNELVCYSNGEGSPAVEVILQKYGYIARFVCVNCGMPAHYETRGYIASLCETCFRNNGFERDICDDLEFKDSYEVVGFRDGKSYKSIVSVKDEWNRYLQNFCGEADV